MGAELRDAVRDLGVGGAERELRRRVGAKDVDRGAVLARVSAPVRERVVDARDGLAREHAERREAAARVEEALLAVQRVGSDEPVELVGDVADERQVRPAPGPVRVVEHRFEEHRLQGNRDERVLPVARGLEEHHRARRVRGGEPGEVKVEARLAGRLVAGLAPEVKRPRDRRRREVRTHTGRGRTNARVLPVDVDHRRPVVDDAPAKVAPLAGLGAHVFKRRARDPGEEPLGHLLGHALCEGNDDPAAARGRGRHERPVEHPGEERERVGAAARASDEVVDPGEGLDVVLKPVLGLGASSRRAPSG